MNAVIFTIVAFTVSFSLLINSQKEAWQSAGNPKRGSYFLSPGGNDDNPGTKMAPWKTLEKANRSLLPGDTVTLMDGTYNGMINPVSTGSGKNGRIIYRSQNYRKSILKGQEGSDYIITLKGRSFVVIQGFSLLPAKNGFGYIEDCRNITIENCRMEGSSRVYCPLEFLKSHNIRFLFNDINRVISRTEDSKIHGDGVHFIDCDSSIIEGNTFHKIGHSPLRIWSTGINEAAGFIIRSNCFHNGWGRNFEFFNLQRPLFENNLITEAYNGASSADAKAKVFFSDGIFRFNLIYENWDLAVASMSYNERFSKAGTPLLLENTRIYSNTFKDNPMPAWEMGSYIRTGSQILSNIFINNLFINNGYMSGFNSIIFQKQGCASDNKLINNIFYGRNPDEAALTVSDEKMPVKLSNSKFPTQLENFDYKPGSGITLSREKRKQQPVPKIPLTTTTGDGSGNEILVRDARYFFDGFGIEGETGDIIYIGKPEITARIIKADIKSSILTIDRYLKWKQGDPVTLAFTDKASEPGIPERGIVGKLLAIPLADPVTASPGRKVSFRINILNSTGKCMITWRIGDTIISGKKEFEHIFNKAGDYPVMLSVTDMSGRTSNSFVLTKVRDEIDPKEPLIKSDFEEVSFEEWGYQWDHGPSRQGKTYFPQLRDDGRGQCMSVVASNGNSMLAANIKMRVWNLEKYPRISFSYKIPAGVPVGIWLAPWPSSDRPARICIGGSPASSKGSMPGKDICKLIDDGKWHNAEIDAREIKSVIPGLDLIYAFEFYTYTTASADQKFWFDDFMIKPDN